jgi:hypothetical protein
MKINDQLHLYSYLGGVSFKLRVDCDTTRHPRWLVEDRKRGVRLACTTMGSTTTLPPLWIFQNYGTYFLLRTADEGTKGIETKVGATTSTSTADTDSWTKL